MGGSTGGSWSLNGQSGRSFTWILFSTCCIGECPPALSRLASYSRDVRIADRVKSHIACSRTKRRRLRGYQSRLQRYAQAGSASAPILQPWPIPCLPLIVPAAVGALYFSISLCGLSAHARLRVLREGQSSVAFPIERVAASCGAILRKTLGRTRPKPNEPAPPGCKLRGAVKNTDWKARNSGGFKRRFRSG